MTTILNIINNSTFFKWLTSLFWMLFSKQTIYSITAFFKDFSITKLLLFVVNPLVILYSNYYSMFFALSFIILVDLRFGIRVYCKEKKLKISFTKPSSWGVITSSGFRQTLNKGKDYFFIIFSVWLLENYMLHQKSTFWSYTLTHLSFIVLSAVEMWSIGENFRKLRGYNFFELLQKIFTKKDLKSAIEELKKEKHHKEL